MKKLVNLAWYWQLLILVGVGALMFGGVRYMWTSTTQAETATILEEVNTLQAKNQAAQIATQRINEFRALFASKSVEYDELKVLLPEQREITNILQGLQDSAAQSRLIVMRFSPRDDVTEDFVVGKPVEVEVDANYTNLRAFFDKMAKLQRVVSITDFNLEQLPNQSAAKSLHARFLLTAYYATPEVLNNLNDPKKAEDDGKGKKGKKGKGKDKAEGDKAAPAGGADPAADGKTTKGDKTKAKKE